MSSILYILVGIPGSGKSTWIETTASKDDIVVSRDKIRNQFLEEGDTHFAKENQVYREYVRQIQEGLDNKKHVFADATHVSEASRMKLIKRLDLNECEVIPVFMDTSKEECFRRNNERPCEVRCPERDMKRFSKDLSDPKDDEYVYDWVFYELGDCEDDLVNIGLAL